MSLLKKIIGLLWTCIYCCNAFAQMPCATYQAAEKLGIAPPLPSPTPTAEVRGNEFIIPTVFHILYQEESDAITFQEIQNAMDFINRRLRNEFEIGAATIDPAFQNLAADTEIQLALAGKDPLGNCTNGFTKTFTDSTAFVDFQSPKFERSGGKDAWDARQYLNVWVVQDLGAIAGVASFPNNLLVEQNFDGIVISKHHLTNALAEGVFLHELGHWVGLPHIFGATDICCVSQNCNIDDGFDDTPNTEGHLPDDTNFETCGSLDNLQNYMDYTTERLMFTPDQVAQMHTTLHASEGYRNGIWTADNLTRTGIIGNEDCDHLTQFYANTWIFEAFPSPFQNELRVRIRAFEDRNISLRLFDTSGRIVLEDAWKMIGQKYYDVTFLNAGIYFLKIDNGETSQVIKLIKY